MLADDASGLFVQECRHEYWGAMFLLSHLAEMTQKEVSGDGNAQCIMLVKCSQH
jgi:hypothetical protein